MQFLSLSEQLTRISQCLFSIRIVSGQSQVSLRSVSGQSLLGLSELTLSVRQSQKYFVLLLINVQV